MSRGIGELQREILRRCEDFYHEFERGESWPGGKLNADYCPVVFSRGQGFYLNFPMIDLRLVKQRIGNDQIRYTNSTLSAAFSRAVRSLIRRGLLKRRLDPVEDSREIRFVEIMTEDDRGSRLSELESIIERGITAHGTDK